MIVRRTAMLLMLVAGPALAQPPVPPGSRAAAADTPSGGSKRIFLPPPVEWDKAMLSARPALAQTAMDLANLTDGIVFGMTPGKVNAHLPDPYPGLSWDGLPLANEYPGEVRFFGAPLDRAGRLGIYPAGCAGAASYIVFLFNGNGLFRLSYRLITDKSCADTNEAAQGIFARYVSISQTVAVSVRYRTATTQVVDVTDPAERLLLPIRYRQGLK